MRCVAFLLPVLYLHVLGYFCIGKKNMKKIDRYILQKYLTTFFFCLTLFTAVVVVVDLSEKAGDFSRIKLSLWQLIMQYYIGFIPHIDAMLFPLFVFLSVIFLQQKWLIVRRSLPF